MAAHAEDKLLHFEDLMHVATESQRTAAELKAKVEEQKRALRDLQRRVR
jgi:hypothetical protein